MKELKVKGYEITIFDDKIRKDDPVIWIHTFPGEAENIRAQMKEQCILIGITGADWNQDFRRGVQIGYSHPERILQGMQGDIWTFGKGKSTSHRAARTVKQNNRQQRGFSNHRKSLFRARKPDGIITTQRNGQIIVAELFFNHSGTETFRDKLLKMILADRTE